MRSKWILILVSVVLVTALSACGPAASALKSGSVLTAGSVQGGGSPNSASAPSQATIVSQQATAPGVRSIAVTGEGRATLTPDMAYVNIGVHTENPDVGEALAANKSQAQAVADAIKKLGVDAKDIQTTNFNIYPQQQYDNNGQITNTKYVVENTVYVTLRDLSKLGNLLDTAVKAGANNIYGVQFDVADKTGALSQARKDAIKNAHDQAAELASASGVNLGQVYSISATTLSSPIPMSMAKGMGGGAAAPAMDVPVSPGQMIITVDVTITYEIQ